MSTGGQVQLSKLIFTHNWEDPRADEAALDIQQGDRLFTITSGGCNTLGFLRFNPKSIHCADINAAQTFVMELKQAAFRRLDYEELLAFLGIRRHPNRKEVFQQLAPDLSKSSKEFWDQHLKILGNGIIMNGRYEKFVKIAAWLMRTIQGSAKIKKLFMLDSLEEQKTFYEKRWNNRRWRWIFRTMFNKKRLAKKGLDADYFHFDDGSASFSESFMRRAAHALCDLPVKDNYFLALYLLGHYRDESNLPAYLMPENFNVIKNNIDLIIPVTADSKYWLETQAEDSIDAMALSNICELMDDADTLKLFSEVLRTCRDGAKLVFRNLMIPRDVPPPLQVNVVKDDKLSKVIQFNDRSFVYSKVAAYQIHKNANTGI